jgi:hypothetical protein
LGGTGPPPAAPCLKFRVQALPRSVRPQHLLATGVGQAVHVPSPSWSQPDDIRRHTRTSSRQVDDLPYPAHATTCLGCGGAESVPRQSWSGHAGRPGDTRLSLDHWLVDRSLSLAVLIRTARRFPDAKARRNSPRHFGVVRIRCRR